MKISILIATKTAGAELVDTLASVRSQAHSDWELIVAKIGADDDSGKMLRQFKVLTGHPVHHELLPEGTSLAVARNRLLELATGDPVAFIDSGDTWTVRHLANALPELTSGADLVVSDIWKLDHAGFRLPAVISVPALLGTNPTRLLFTRDAITSISSVVFRRQLVARAGGFDGVMEAGQVRDFWFRCALSDARFAPTSRATCQRAAPRNSTEQNVLQAAEAAVLFYEKHRDLAAVPSALRRRLLAASLVVHGKLLRTPDPARAARCFWRAWSLQPMHVQTLGQFALTGWRSNPPASSAPACPSRAVENGRS